MSAHKSFIRDVSRVKNLNVFFIGLIAGLAVSILKPGVIDPSAKTIAAHLLVSALVAFGYALLMRSSRRTGFQISLIHWLLSSVIIGLIPGRPDLSFFMAGDGMVSFIAYAIMHFIYGILVGVMFDRCSIRLEYPKPMNRSAFS